MLQYELAQALGVSWRSLSRWEAGTHRAPRMLGLALAELERRLAHRTSVRDAKLRWTERQREARESGRTLW